MEKLTKLFCFLEWLELCLRLILANCEIYQPVHENAWCLVDVENADFINRMSIDSQSPVRKLQKVGRQ